MRSQQTLGSIKKGIWGAGLLLSSVLVIQGCSSNNENSKTTENTPAANAPAETSGTFDTISDKGIGPVTSVEIGTLNNDSAAKGEGLFKAKCTACHKIDARLVGPALKGVTIRRSPEWIMNQILNPAEQDTKDPVGKALLAKYMTQMTNQNVTQADARNILEYLRSIDASK